MLGHRENLIISHRVIGLWLRRATGKTGRVSNDAHRVAEARGKSDTCAPYIFRFFDITANIMLFRISVFRYRININYDVYIVQQILRYHTKDNLYTLCTHYFLEIRILM